MPPSVNRLYRRAGRGGKTLSDEGKSWKAKALIALGKQWVTVPRSVFKKNVPYELWIRFTYEGVVNKGWPKSSKTRYKRKDVSNYVKLLEDVISEVSGIDDSQTVRLIVEKQERSEALYEGEPCIQILLKPLE